LQVTGRTHSRTRAYPRDNEGVTIHNRNYTDFWAGRRVDFSPEGFTARDVDFWADAHNRTVDAETPVDWVPVLGWIAQGTAKSEARRRRPQSEAIAESRVRDRVVPDFTAESDQAIADLNDAYGSRLRDPLVTSGLAPEVVDTNTTRTHLFVRARLADDAELGGHLPRLWVPGDAYAVIQLHQSAVNNMVDRLELAGGTFDEATLQEHVRAKLAALLPPPSEESGETEEQAQGNGNTVTFAEQDPIRVRFEGGEIDVTLRAASLQGPQGRVAGQMVRVRYRPEVAGDVVRWSRIEQIEVTPLKKPETDVERAQALAVALVLRGVFNELFPEQFETPAKFEVQDSAGESRTVRVEQVKMLDGWVSVAVR
ncbi:MAG: hypothetical protein ACOC46_02925, partial [Pirellulales bacterium]